MCVPRLPELAGPPHGRPTRSTNESYFERIIATAIERRDGSELRGHTRGNDPLALGLMEKKCYRDSSPHPSMRVPTDRILSNPVS